MTRQNLAKACLAATVLISGSAFGAWPVLRTYSGEALRRVKMPLGGIGTGTISLSGRGSLVDWELRSAPRKGFTPSHANFAPHFAIRGETADGRRFARLLEGPLLPEEYEGCEGVPVKNHGFPRFAAATFKAAYPLAQVELSDPKVPLEVRLEAMNPLVPGDAEASGIPAALLRWQVRNPTDKPMRVSVAGSLVRFGNVDLALVAVTNGATLTAADRVREPGWSAWNVPLDRYWRRFVEEGVVSDSAPSEPNGTPVFQRCLSAEIAAGGTRSFVFAIGWRYASRGAWDMWEDGRVTGPAGEVGNWYATRFASAEAAANHLLSNLPDLEAKTLAFVEKVLSVRAPDVVREAALFNLSTLRTETCFRTADGHFFGFEGCLDNTGSCYGTCTHVWGYEHCLVDLWPELARDILDQCYGPRLDQEAGHMGFRVGLPLATKARASRLAAADGQMQMLVRAYEYWKKSGDAAWLKAKYPSVRKALEFCWVAGGWDADRDGVMEGCQHNTMDVEYFGPNPQMEFLYLAALEAVSAMAEACGDGAFASDLRTLRAKGSAWTEANLFNGSYYEHRIVPPKGPIAAGIRHARIGARNLSDPEFQLGAGCLVDQLVGDFAARAAGLPPVTDEAHARTTLATILAKCRRNPDDEVFNNMRDFILPGEAGLRMAWYPEGRKPRSPFPYYQETMTGFEYVVAAGLAQRGDFAAAERVVRDIRDRYDGVKRNPFDEAECGHHYVRALAAWSVLKAFGKVVP